ncbi:MAG: glycosyltransferase [Candidatus Peribacteraceae bacterium]|nr:glycosyltransferase [Candidatus Peribacteraceae bacterium]
MKLALVADWLPVFGGAEHAIAEFVKVWPQAPLFTTVANRKALGPLGRADIRTTRLQPWYRLLRRHQVLLPWMPRAIEDIDLRGYDTVLSSSHAVAKGVIVPPTAVHVCYCHTPMRYAWEMEETYLRDFRVPRLLRKTVKRTLARLRRWDLTTAKRVDVYVANSTETQRRIARIYGRNSIVVTPPVDDRFFVPTVKPAGERTGYLAVGRLVPYKRFDLLIEAANRLGLPLIIAGRGQEEGRLRTMAGSTVTFRGFVTDEELMDLYGSAKAVLFPQHEDAGIVPLEAQACGTPVIALGAGGALDTVREGVTGVFFREQTSASLEDAIRRFSGMTFDPHIIRDHARQFSATKFRERMREIVEKAASR